MSYYFALIILFILNPICVVNTAEEDETKISFCPATIVTGPQNSIHCKPRAVSDSVWDDEDVKLAENTTVTVGDGTMSQCENDLLRLFTSVTEEWAWRMLDAAGKPTSGILQSSIVWPGDYFECLNTTAPPDGNDTAFNGLYCTLSYDIKYGNASLPISAGICVPDTCDDTTLMNLTHLTRKFSPTPLNPKRMTGISCRPKTIPWDAPAIVMLTIISIFAVLVVAGTGMTIYEKLIPKDLPKFTASSPELTVNDIRTDEDNYSVDCDIKTTDETAVLHETQNDHQRHQPPPPEMFKKFLKCFCAVTNGAKLLDTSNKGEFRCVHGIRFLSMSWVILGHTYAFLMNSGLSVGIFEVLYRSRGLAFEGITHGVLAVDSFFLLSGFLLTYLFLKEAEKTDGKISWGLYYFHRYWRLTPVYAIVLGFDVALTRYVGDGPVWPIDGNEGPCKETWWWNLLYINNFVSMDKMCFGWSWFLANDMQFYVISPIFLYCLWRWPKIGLSIVGSLLLGVWICSGCISWENQFFSGLSSLIQVRDLQAFGASMQDYFSKFYIKPYTRAGPYLVGVFLGYILFKEKDKKFSLSLVAQITGWVVATVVALTTVYGLHDTAPNMTVSSFYNALSSSLFTAALAWVIFVCITGRGGFVNKILSYELFIPLSRLTYCAYLVHPIIIIGYYQSLENNIQVTSTMTATLFLAFMVLSYMTAFVTSLMFEAPFMAIEKLFIKKK